MVMLTFGELGVGLAMLTTVIGGWLMFRPQQDEYEALAERIRRPAIWTIRHPVQAIRRRMSR